MHLNQHRTLGVGELRARYRRRKIEGPPIAASCALHDAWEERATHPYYDEGWYQEDITPLDALWAALVRRIETALPFNSLLLGREFDCRDEAPWELETTRSDVEWRLIEHSKRLLAHDSIEPDRNAELAAALLPLPQAQQLYRVATEALAGELTPVVACALFVPLWRRSLVEFRGRRPEDLVAYLFGRYDYPRCLAAGWRGAARTVELRWLLWTVALALGCRLKVVDGALRGQAPERWGTLHKSFTRNLFAVPAYLPPRDAIILAEVSRLGGGAWEAERLRSFFHHDPTACDETERAFFEDVVRWMVRHQEGLEELGEGACRRVLAWGWHRHHEQPGSFSWRGRTPRSAWRETVAERRVWSASSHRGLRWEPRGWGWQGELRGQLWSAKELTTSEALRDESIAMQHCVRGYDLACQRGDSAIFSLRCGEERHLTVELRPQTLLMAQARGLCNRLPRRAELEVLDRWLSELRRSRGER